MVYIDTSVLVKLYVREQYSLEASKWIQENNEAIPLTRFHELEFMNAIQLKGFRSEIHVDQVKWVLSKFEEHSKNGIYFHPVISWAETWHNAVNLSAAHTWDLGSRSLDILHVSSALTLNTHRFFTLDEKQARLASAAGLTVVQI
jgi:predicted nucleic acid-binding protein